MSGIKSPLRLRVLDSEIKIGEKRQPVEWGGFTFPESFTVALVIEDHDFRKNGKVWGLRWSVTFTRAPIASPTIGEVTLRGSWLPDSWTYRRDPKTGKRTRVQTKIAEPFEWDAKTDSEQVQLWQVRYLEENLHVLKRAALDIVATNSTFEPTNDPSTAHWYIEQGGEWNPKPQEKPLQDFGKLFNEWQGRKLLSDDLLREVAGVYREGSPNGREAVATYFDKPLPTASRWVRAAKDRGFIKEATQAPKAKPKKRGKK